MLTLTSKSITYGCLSVASDTVHCISILSHSCAQLHAVDGRDSMKTVKSHVGGTTLCTSCRRRTSLLTMNQCNKRHFHSRCGHCGVLEATNSSTWSLGRFHTILFVRQQAFDFLLLINMIKGVLYEVEELAALKTSYL